MSHFCQQDEVYRAEGEAPRGGELEDVQSFLDNLVGTEWWDREYAGLVERVEAHVRPSDARESVGSYDAASRAGLVEMAPAHCCERIVLHELAHVLCGATYGRNAHGPWFCMIYLQLVSRVMGPDTYLPLYEAFERYGIEVAAPSPRVKYYLPGSGGAILEDE